MAEEALTIFGILTDDEWLSRLDGSHLTAMPAGGCHVGSDKPAGKLYLLRDRS